MTPQENQALQLLLSQLTQIRGIPKDAEAERMIAEAAARQPDAAYLLVQRVMLMEQALESAKAQIARLESRGQGTSATSGSSFLDANAWGNTGSGYASPAAASPAAVSVTGRPLSDNNSSMYNAPPASAPFGSGRPPGSGFLGGGGGSSMLGTLAATAAGVAGGAFLFHGIGNLLDQQRSQDQQGHEAQGLASDQAGQAGGNNEFTELANSVPSDAPQVEDNSFSDNSFADNDFSGDSSFDEA